MFRLHLQKNLESEFWRRCYQDYIYGSLLRYGPPQMCWMNPHHLQWGILAEELWEHLEVKRLGSSVLKRWQEILLWRYYYIWIHLHWITSWKMYSSVKEILFWMWKTRIPTENGLSFQIILKYSSPRIFWEGFQQSMFPDLETMKPIHFFLKKEPYIYLRNWGR